MAEPVSSERGTGLFPRFCFAVLGLIKKPQVAVIPDRTVGSRDSPQFLDSVGFDEAAHRTVLGDSSDYQNVGSARVECGLDLIVACVDSLGENGLVLRHASLTSFIDPPQRASVWIEIQSPCSFAMSKSSSQLRSDRQPEEACVFTSAMNVMLPIMASLLLDLVLNMTRALCTILTHKTLATLLLRSTSSCSILYYLVNL